jgi:putative transposase
MARIARVVAPGIPHHVVQRGVRRMQVFIRESDKTDYLKILKYQSQRFGVDIWAYCLMDNHVHIIAVPKTSDSLAKAIGQTHNFYTRMVNFREGWKGYLWEGRFKSYVLDESYLYAALRYVEQNPVKAGIVGKAEDYPWSSARTHVNKTPDPILSDFFLGVEIPNWSEFLRGSSDGQEQVFERHLQTGRPLGDDGFVDRLEVSLGRILRKDKTGPSKKGHSTKLV